MKQRRNWIAWALAAAAPALTLNLLTVSINQQEEPAHARLFRALGTFRFEAGRAGWVRVSNDGTETSKVVIADAVQFLPVHKPNR